MLLSAILSLNNTNLVSFTDENRIRDSNPISSGIPIQVIEHHVLSVQLWVNHRGRRMRSDTKPLGMQFQLCTFACKWVHSHRQPLSTRDSARGFDDLLEVRRKKSPECGGGWGCAPQSAGLLRRGCRHTIDCTRVCYPDANCNRCILETGKWYLKGMSRMCPTNRQNWLDGCTNDTDSQYGTKG